MSVSVSVSVCVCSCVISLSSLRCRARVQGLAAGGQFLVHVPGAAQQQPRPTKQLEQLKAMGFEDEQKCLDALQRTGGNVEAAINLLC